jgi:hypothetical protein
VHNLQLQVDQCEAATDRHALEMEQAALQVAHSRMLQSKLDLAVAQNEELQEQLKQLQQPTAVDNNNWNRNADGAAHEPSSALAVLNRVMEEAPPAVLRELHRVRLNLAETQRRERQLTRRVQALETRNKTFIQEREQARQQARRLPGVEHELDEMRIVHERCMAENETFRDLGRRLSVQLRVMTSVAAAAAVPNVGDDDNNNNNSMAPPELSTMLRVLQTAHKEANRANQECQEYKDKCSRLQEQIRAHEVGLQQALEKEQAWSTERQDLQQQLEWTLSQVDVLQGLHAIYKREADSLRALIQTFDGLPLASRGRFAVAAAAALADEHDEMSFLPSMDATAEAVKVSLASTRQEVELITKDRDRVRHELQLAVECGNKNRDELERVRGKFARLRDALQTERGKVESANARADQAEALAGKGSFDPHSTRVLHLNETPLIQALKEEVKVLKRQIEAIKGSGDVSFSASSASSKLVNAPDPDKLNQRLKQNFKEQIAVFREGVYLMTGYKVDMLPGADQPTFRVRSMYAEREEDHLLFQWPKKLGGGDPVTSLDVLNTDLAKVLTTTPSYSYMTKCHSLPAFLSSVQLSLFEKQTVMM